jgi:hypothetical protein
MGMSSSQGVSRNMGSTYHGDFAKHVHTYLGAFIRAADQKAAFVLVASTALFGWLVSQKTAGHPLALGWKTWILGATILVAFAALFAVLSVWPRQHGIKTGLIAWNGILRVGGGGLYTDAISRLTPAEELRQIAGHSYELAEILRKKYLLLWWAILAFILGGAATAISLILAFLGQR